ncbi:tolloid-like protein 1 [Orbicella faveolata]|uniref:tolloid-like protein 1 n=1 Tax=Orbicella faveolata TaxID=48498 RepID=UPI0009E4C429|nr:tolloid-like protein 1 [Orbicella faveolata]
MAVKSGVLALLYSLFLMSDAESCPNQNLTDWAGSFQPSSYPSKYAPNLDCYWLIQVSDGNLIEINFQDFAMDGDTVDNCPNDYVEVLEGSYGSTDSIKRVCGANLPFEDEYRVVRSKGSSLLVHMHTDDANQNRGFAANHQGICKVTFSTVSGTIMSPNHPDKYPNSVMCEWIIDLGPGYDITLTFHKFNLEKKDDCSWDWLTVQAGNTPDSPVVIKVCGDVLPPDIKTSGPMRIYFQTDNDNEFEGFHMTWVAEDQNECNKPESCHSNATCANTDGSYQCTCMLSYTGDGKTCQYYKASEQAPNLEDEKEPILGSELTRVLQQYVEGRALHAHSFLGLNKKDVKGVGDRAIVNDLLGSIPVLSEYAKSLESRVKERYSQKISVIGVDPESITAEQFSPEFLPPVEVSALLSYLVLETNFYTNKQFKAFKSLEAFNHMVSGFLTSVVGKVIAEATTRIHGKLACTQVKCSWILPTYVNEVPDARAKDIDFSSANKPKEKLDQKIEDLQQPQASNHAAASSSGTASASASAHAARIGAFERGNGSALCQTQPVQK